MCETALTRFRICAAVSVSPCVITTSPIGTVNTFGAALFSKMEDILSLSALLCSKAAPSLAFVRPVLYSPVVNK